MKDEFSGEAREKRRPKKCDKKKVRREIFEIDDSAAFLQCAV
jgi:hypothetical protein